MVLRGIKEVQAYKARVKRDNLERWYEKNPWARNDSLNDERDLADEDYPGIGLEAEFWDIPNIH